MEHPLVKNDMRTQLWALSGDRWAPYGRVKVALCELLGWPGKLRFRNLLLKKGMYIHASLEKDRYGAWDGFGEYLYDGDDMAGLGSSDERERLLQPFLGLGPREGGCMAWGLSDRLGLPLVRVTVQFIALPQETGEIKALSLPLMAEGINELMPVAALSVGPNGWRRVYDYTQSADLAVRSLPAISGTESPVLRAVFPQKAVASASSPLVQNACEWYALTPDLLARLRNGSLQIVCFFAIHEQGLEVHLTLLQRMPPAFWLDLAGVRLLELRYLAKIYPAIQEDAHYKALLRIVNLAHHNRVYYEYDPNYYWDGSKGDRRFWEWQAQEDKPDQSGKYKPIPYIIPYVEQIILDKGGDPSIAYCDFFASKAARQRSKKPTDLDSMQTHEAVDVPVKMNEKQELFRGQWENEDGAAYKKLRELKMQAIGRLSGRGSVRAQMLDLDWWAYSDQLCNSRTEPALGKEFRDVLSEAVRPEEQ
jgi:hypothetical protein